MNLLDQARALADSIRATEEYREYMRLKQVAYEDSTNRTLIDEYQRLQFTLQARMAGGESMDSESLERLSKIGQLLQFNPDARDYLMAQIRFQKIMADVYQVLGDVAGFDLDTLIRG